MDVVVVGGGVVGTACAWALARRGVRVTLVERSELAAGASGRNHGLLFVPSDPALLPMARLTAESYDGLSGDAPWIRLDPEPIGFLLVAADESEAELAEAEASAARAVGVEVEPVGAGRLLEVEPALSPDLVGGWLLSDGRRLDPAALTVAMGHAAAAAGARVRRHLAARAILREGSRARGVVTDEGVVHTDEVIVSAGPWSASLLRPLGVRLPIVSARGWLVHLGSGPGHPSLLVERAGWHLLPGGDVLSPATGGELAEGSSEPEVGTLLQPTTSGTLLAGGSRQAAITPEPEDPGIPSRILAAAASVVPAARGLDVLGAWWGLRPMTPDARPLVGRVGEGLLVATGHGSQGVILGAGTGELVAAMVTGEPPALDPEPFDPARAPQS